MDIRFLSFFFVNAYLWWRTRQTEKEKVCMSYYVVNCINRKWERADGLNYVVVVSYAALCWKRMFKMTVRFWEKITWKHQRSLFFSDNFNMCVYLCCQVARNKMPNLNNFNCSERIVAGKSETSTIVRKIFKTIRIHRKIKDEFVSSTFFLNDLEVNETIIINNKRHINHLLIKNRFLFNFWHED